MAAPNMMTPEAISTALVAALTFAEKTGATEVVKKAAGDAYDSLKSLILGKFGKDSEPAQALARLEANPASKPRLDTLTEELTTVDAANDPDLVSATTTLLDLIRSLPKGEQHIQSAHGNRIFQNQGDHFSGTVNFGSKMSKEKDDA